MEYVAFLSAPSGIVRLTFTAESGAGLSGVHNQETHIKIGQGVFLRDSVIAVVPNDTVKDFTVFRGE
ncbi:MAG: hypothetical protein ACR2OG_13385 [Gemmatimonadaceae bacterium]